MGFTTTIVTKIKRTIPLGSALEQFFPADLGRIANVYIYLRLCLNVYAFDICLVCNLRSYVLIEIVCFIQ